MILMTKITAPVKDFGGIVAGVQFKDGVGEAPEDFEHLHYFVEHGYTVGEKPADKSAPEGVKTEAEFPDGDPSEQWKAAQLKAYATANGIDLGGATNKPAMVEAIAAAKASTGAPTTPADAEQK